MNKYASTIIGIRNVSFTGTDGTPVTGKTIFFSEPIAPKDGEGVSADKAFFSSARLADMDFTPAIGCTVEVLYGKTGKARDLRLVDDGMVVVD